MKLIEEDSKENFYDYNSEEYNGDLLDIELERNEYGFGLALSGHQNRDVMGTFICGIHPKGSAAEEGSLQPGDEILKVKSDEHNQILFIFMRFYQCYEDDDLLTYYYNL